VDRRNLEVNGSRCVGRLDYDGASGGCGETVLVGHHVVDGVGGDLAGVDDDLAFERAVEERGDAEVEVLLWAGDGGAEVGVAVAAGNNPPRFLYASFNPAPRSPRNAMALAVS